MQSRREMPRMDCAVDATMSVLEGRWKSTILCVLAKWGPKRFNQLVKTIEGVSPRMLTKQLKEMEKDGIVERRAYLEVPPRVEYSITEKGMSLAPVLEALAKWGRENMFYNLVEFDTEKGTVTRDEALADEN
ncbi:MAG: helix-turn-helix domain-containing protein [Candidatus Methanomethylophilaceae archaeon]|nr:helix-turn-helix domain-containing protein [Candidatus Methanomethylophilaceae archaeon]